MVCTVTSVLPLEYEEHCIKSVVDFGNGAIIIISTLPFHVHDRSLCLLVSSVPFVSVVRHQDVKGDRGPSPPELI